ncbi:hypothetical protein KIN20_008348 [Parelaphostrongylus tenuis]|uniref:Uncharacterized protein n=1 Tax=Parelaphostrongylus tenuis TaxID=148309 RepID=A0AAD5MMQ0_PARTN|nr:hypothetical protein KIN20_008348 [Parelaphostrongylus tenuis]
MCIVFGIQRSDAGVGSVFVRPPYSAIDDSFVDAQHPHLNQSRRILCMISIETSNLQCSNFLSQYEWTST